MTPDNNKKSPLFIAAKTVSIVFHPIFIPVYGLLIILSAPTLFGYMPFQVKKILLSIIMVNNVLVPLSLMPYFRYRNIISSWSVENRKERLFPLIATSFFYSVSVFIFWRFQLPVFIKSFILATAFMAITVTIITFWWKISVHTTGAGALLALVMILSVKMETSLNILLICTILSAGLVMTSRLFLNKHIPSEVWAGFLLGLLGSSVILIFI
jgi:hypothetical protein